MVDLWLYFIFIYLGSITAVFFSNLMTRNINVICVSHDLSKLKMRSGPSPYLRPWSIFGKMEDYLNSKFSIANLYAYIIQLFSTLQCRGNGAIIPNAHKSIFLQCYQLKFFLFSTITILVFYIWLSLPLFFIFGHSGSLYSWSSLIDFTLSHFISY